MDMVRWVWAGVLSCGRIQSAQETVTMAMAVTLGETSGGFSVRLGVPEIWLISELPGPGLNCEQWKSGLLV